MAKNDVSRFRVTYCDNTKLGVAVMRGNRVTYKTDKKAYKWFEERDDAWLREFRKVVRKLCISTGHWGKFSITKDEDSGIEVQRLEEGQED